MYAPAIVAKQVADLDRVTGGRVTLGVGIGGEYPGEFRACRVPIEERGPRTDEAIPLLRRLWTGEPVTHDGRFYAMDDVRIHPAPAQPGGPPIVVAGRQRPAMHRAALLGDGWMPYLYSPRRYAESVAVIREHAERGGRSLDHFEWCAFVFVGLHADREQARADTARFLGGTYRQDFRSMVEHVAAVGDVDEVTASLQQFVDAGARHLIFAPASPDRARRSSGCSTTSCPGSGPPRDPPARRAPRRTPMTEPVYTSPDLSLFGDEHVRRYEETDGEEGYLWNGATILVLTTTGRKSGEPRKFALIYDSRGDDLVVVASKGGAPDHPGWYKNLSRSPTRPCRYGVNGSTCAPAPPRAPSGTNSGGS